MLTIAWMWNSYRIGIRVLKARLYCLRTIIIECSLGCSCRMPQQSSTQNRTKKSHVLCNIKVQGMLFVYLDCLSSVMDNEVVSRYFDEEYGDLSHFTLIIYLCSILTIPLLRLFGSFLQEIETQPTTHILQFLHCKAILCSNEQQLLLFQSFLQKIETQPTSLILQFLHCKAGYLVQQGTTVVTSRPNS